MIGGEDEALHSRLLELDVGRADLLELAFERQRADAGLTRVVELGAMNHYYARIADPALERVRLCVAHLGDLQEQALLPSAPEANGADSVLRRANGELSGLEATKPAGHLQPPGLTDRSEQVHPDCPDGRAPGQARPYVPHRP